MCMQLKVTKESPGSVFYLLGFIICVTWSVNTFCLSPSAAFGAWSQRVRFQSSEPTVDSSLVIMSTEVSDEGKYLCRIITYPSGNFDTEMSLTVWSESLQMVKYTK